MAILLNSQEISVYDITDKLEVNQDVVYDWLIKFTDLGIEGLKDKPIPGRLKIEHEKDIKEVLIPQG